MPLPLPPSTRRSAGVSATTFGVTPPRTTPVFTRVAYVRNRMSPCESTPRWFARTRCSARQAASAAASPVLCSSLVVKSRSVAAGKRLSVLIVSLVEAEVFHRRAEAKEVERELALLEARHHARLARLNFLCLGDGRIDLADRYDHHTIGVGDHEVTRIHKLPGDHDGFVEL